MILKTIKVKNKISNVDMIINECDFDENIYELVDKSEKKNNKKQKSNSDLDSLIGGK